jgi:NhaP-type Na+/H+ or K+/H+ antiporter
MACSTLAAVFPETALDPLVTRDTVAVETPARVATSLMVQGILVTPISPYLRLSQAQLKVAMW